VQFGTTEVEAAFDMPQESGGIQFFGNYIFAAQNQDGSSVTAGGAGQADPSWNEVCTLSFLFNSIV
jgi:hypothetical protein